MVLSSFLLGLLFAGLIGFYIEPSARGTGWRLAWKRLVVSVLTVELLVAAVLTATGSFIQSPQEFLGWLTIALFVGLFLDFALGQTHLILFRGLGAAGAFSAIIVFVLVPFIDALRGDFALSQASMP